MKYIFLIYLCLSTLLVAPGEAQELQDAPAILNYDFQLNPEIVEDAALGGPSDLANWADIGSTLRDFDANGCVACLPDPDIIDFPFDQSILDQIERQNCTWRGTTTGMILCEENAGADASLGAAAPQTPEPVPAEDILYAATKTVMAAVRADDICTALMPLYGVTDETCADGRVQVGEDLIIEVTVTSLEDNEFLALIVGRGDLLSKVGPFESHTFNISFALRLDGQPRIVLFNSMPLYTTFASLDRINGAGLREDVKYVPRSEDSAKLRPFQARVGALLRDMIDGRVRLAGNH